MSNSVCILFSLSLFDGVYIIPLGTTRRGNFFFGFLFLVFVLFCFVFLGGRGVRGVGGCDSGVLNF